MKTKFALYINIVLVTIFIFFFYSKIILSPNSYLFSGNGDALKSFYSVAYHTHDKLSFHFNGTNYPYGEDYLFTDCQPIITSLIKCVSFIFPSILTYEIGIINYLLLFSIFFTSIFLYLILVKYKVNGFFAAFCGFFITVLSPQIFRLPAHPFLSYSVSIPLTWLLFLKYNESIHKWKWSVISAVNILFWFFVHTYLGMINVLLFLTFYILNYFWHIKKNKKFNYEFISQIILQYLIPVLIFFITVKATDKFTGRSTNPYGFLLYDAEIETVFIPLDKPFKPILQKIIKIPDQNWEGWSYIGFTSDLILFALFIIVVSSFFNKRCKKIFHSIFENKNLFFLLISSIFLLFYSMGFPFRLHLQWVAEKYPIIKQFRSLGRFAWAFFFVSTICSTYICWRFFEILKVRKNILRFFFLMLPCLYLFEGLPYHKNVSKEIVTSINYFDKKQLPSAISDGLEKINPNKYQAIIPLPYYCGGSDNFGKGAPEGSSIYLLSEVFSFYKHLPIIAQNATRSSIWQAKNFMQLLSPNYYHKNILSDLKSNKKFLVVYSNEEINEYEQYFLDKSTLIFKNNMYSLYSLDFDKFFENTAQEEIQSFNKIKNSLQKKKGFFVRDSSSFVYFKDFEDTPNDTNFEGKGAFSGKLKDINTIGEIFPHTLKTEKDYIVSFWVYNNGENFGQDVMCSGIIQEGDGDKLDWIALTGSGSSQCIKGNWSLVEIKFKIKDSNDKISVLVNGSDKSKKTVHVDNLLIRESNCNIYKILEEKNGNIIKLFKNNQVICK